MQEKPISKLKRIIDKVRNNIAVVIAPIFNSENITDGYFQRINAIDNSVLEHYFKIYLHFQEDYTSNTIEDISFNIIDNKHLEIRIDHRFEDYTDFLMYLFSNCRVIYIHCALRIIKKSTGKSLRYALSKNHKKLVWDVHGVVPEEFALYEDYWGVQEAGEAEAFLIQTARVIICVNKAMERHLRDKYGKLLRSIICILPIFNLIDTQIEDIESNRNQKPVVVYAGGVQKWQKIEEMQDSIAKVGDKCKYKICVSDPEAFMNLWNNRNLVLLEDMEVKRVPPSQLFELYKQCDYGFALRDNSVVNRVACPTKIIEYLQYGIIPILDSEQIGDFVELGMHYLSIKEFCNSKFLDEEKKDYWIKDNFKVLKLLKNQQEKGVKKLKRIIDSINPLCSFYFHLKNKENMAIFYNDYVDCDFSDDRLRDLFVIKSSFDDVYVNKSIQIGRTYCIGKKDIGSKMYGGNKEEFIDFCDFWNIKKIYFNGFENIISVKDFINNNNCFV